MKRVFVFSLFVFLGLLFTNCASHYGSMNGNAALGSKNFKYQGIASGQAQTTQIFGLGGLAKEALVAEAKKNLLMNYPLKDGQALANVIVDFKVSLIFFVITRKVTVTADIVEFN